MNFKLDTIKKRILLNHLVRHAIAISVILCLCCLCYYGNWSWRSYIAACIFYGTLYFMPFIFGKVFGQLSRLRSMPLQLLFLTGTSVLSIRLFNGDVFSVPFLFDENINASFRFVVFFLANAVPYLTGLIFQFVLTDIWLKHTNEKILIEKQQAEMKSLRMQMNPHFVYNCLVNLNHTIRSGNTNKAIDYTTSLSMLLRKQLENAEKETISLTREIEWLKHYINTELSRHPNLFEYEINFNSTDIEELSIPPMLLQPFVENSIKHVFIQSKKTEKLIIDIFKTSFNSYIVKIKDSGQGYLKKHANNLSTLHQSVGLQNIDERLKLLNYISPFTIVLTSNIINDGFEICIEVFLSYKAVTGKNFNVRTPGLRFFDS
jgi:hypothetical protein